MQPLVNMTLMTNEIRIKNNRLPNGEYTLAPRIERNISRRSETEYEVELVCDITNREDQKFPIDLYVSISGIFDVKTLPENAVEDFLNIQAVQILYPYVRSIVSNLTASSFMPAIVLPVINVRDLKFDK